jgi:hypothetical protein
MATYVKGKTGGSEGAQSVTGLKKELLPPCTPMHGGFACFCIKID